VVITKAELQKTQALSVSEFVTDKLLMKNNDKLKNSIILRDKILKKIEETLNACVFCNSAFAVLSSRCLFSFVLLFFIAISFIVYYSNSIGQRLCKVKK
jgi:Ca2+-dependent lipid-binding protein